MFNAANQNLSFGWMFFWVDLSKMNKWACWMYGGGCMHSGESCFILNLIF